MKATQLLAAHITEIKTMSAPHSLCLCVFVPKVYSESAHVMLKERCTQHIGSLCHALGT